VTEVKEKAIDSSRVHVLLTRLRHIATNTSTRASVEDLEATNELRRQLQIELEAASKIYEESKAKAKQLAQRCPHRDQFCIDQFCIGEHPPTGCSGVRSSRQQLFKLYDIMSVLEKGTMGAELLGNLTRYLTF
jgi:hypothetical protein